MKCPITGRDCQRDCGFVVGDKEMTIDCKLSKVGPHQQVLQRKGNDTDRRHGERRKQFAPGNSYFIESQHLGVLEVAVQAMLRKTLKRSRRIELNHIQQVLKTLNLIPHSEKVVALGLATLDNGDSGLVILCSSPHHVQGDVPTPGNYAQERKEARE